ncbi:Cyclopentanone 1,2-monooxygenase (CPMO) [Quaeritorhiza haematococci]|nr:Cyclopentanone 1,2-monooxygenase (CPMO) [Quaeritorhiza haematococci]
MSQEANVSGLASPSASPILHSADLPNQLSSSIDSASDREQAESFKDGYMVPSNFPLLSDSSMHAIPKSILNFALETITRFSTGDLQKYGLKPEHRPLEAHPTVHGEVLGRITTGKVLVRSNISKFTSSSVIFEDQSEEEIDAVFYCTGYKIEHPFLDSQDILGQQDPKSNKIHLYKNIFPLHYKNIAFIGLVQPGGSILPVAEMQSRYVSRVFAGRCDPLPAERVMRAEVLKHMEEREKSYVPKERHTIEVDYISYMDELAELVGCKVDLWNLWRTNWTLAAMITFGPAIPAQYRLQGPGSWKGAEPTIREACKGYDFTKICGYKAVERLRDVPAGKDDRADEKANTESAN